MSLEFQVAGLDALGSKLTGLYQQLVSQAGDALRAEAEIEMTKAKQRTPVLTGRLRASGHVTGPDVSGDETTVTLAFGGPAVEYALFVHENEEAFHHVGQAKYLESVLMESAPYLAQRVADRLKRTVVG